MWTRSRRCSGSTSSSSAARAALGRPAATGRDGAGDRPTAEGVPHGRAALEPRREAPRRHARVARPAPPALGVTTVYVTHDQVEAMTLGQRVAVMRDGRILQVDAPQRLYEQPRDLFVAGFIGSPAMNLVEATIDGDDVVLRRVPRSARSATAPCCARRTDVVLGIRPESFEDAAFATARASAARRRGGRARGARL